MSFDVLAIRSGLDSGDDVRYPALSDTSGPGIIAMEPYDGPNVTRVVATAVTVMRVGNPGLKTLTRLRDVKIDVYITDGRLALACEKYDKGGGWVGFGGAAFLVAVAANAVSKARAASRSRGKVLAGHIRYPWLKAVGASSKSGFTSTEAIRLEYSEMLSGTPVRKLIELTLPKNIDATLVASEIVRRAAAYRLAYYPNMTAEAREKFASLSQAPPRLLQPQPKQFAFCQMPTYFHVSAQTAFPGRPRSADPVPMVRAEPGVRASADGGPGVLGWPAVPDQAQAFCTQCGVRHVPGDLFCGQCGVAVNGFGNYQAERVTRY